MPFGTKEYWDREFEKGIYIEFFDWVCDWNDIDSEIAMLIPDKNAAVLVPGCGNAPFQCEMHDAGYKGLVRGDYSEPAIEKM